MNATQKEIESYIIHSLFGGLGISDVARRIHRGKNAGYCGNYSNFGRELQVTRSDHQQTEQP